MNKNIVDLNNISHHVYDKKNSLKVLDKVSLSIGIGEIISLYGVSGAGKTTLFNIIGLIDKPTSGSVKMYGIDCTSNNINRNKIRRSHIGYIYQSPHLISNLSVYNNIIIPCLINNTQTKDLKEKVFEISKKMGMENLLDLNVNVLSGGEKQRVSILRALIKNPSLILADEPTANLDHDNAYKIFDFLKNYCIENNASLFVITHDLVHIKYSNKSYCLNYGKLSFVKTI